MYAFNPAFGCHNLIKYITLSQPIHVNNLLSLPRAGSGVVRIDPLHFLAGCRTRRLNQALSVTSLGLDFFQCVCCAVNQGHFFSCVLCYLCVLGLGCSCQVVSTSARTHFQNEKTYSLTHSLTLTHSLARCFSVHLSVSRITEHFVGEILTCVGCDVTSKNQ